MTHEPAGVVPAPVVDRLAEAVRERYGSAQLADVLGPAGAAALDIGVDALGDALLPVGG
ncbi:MAG TPA: hypothetical protein VJ851_08190 [Jatrophihabitans sp.]|nr:hypothetical protein [Jatrophihabitans sp.]